MEATAQAEEPQPAPEKTAPAPTAARPPFTLFPSPEEQIERIAEASAENQRLDQLQIGLDTPAASIPDAVFGRALTSGGNEWHSIERIVAFFQKNPDPEEAAAFLREEYGDGFKGVSIGGKKYALAFDDAGFHMAQGDSALVPNAVTFTWRQAAEQISGLLRDGQFATQERILAARENEFQEMSETLWYIRHDFSDEAKEAGFLSSIQEAYAASGFPESTLQIAELLKDPEKRAEIAADIQKFDAALRENSDLLRFHYGNDLSALYNRMTRIDQPSLELRVTESFEPVYGSFVTRDEIDRLLRGGGQVSDGKIRIYSYFVQGHNPQECVAFLKNEYGDGGHGYLGYDETHNAKGLKLKRADEHSGYDGYDTAFLNWNQVQKRIRQMIENGSYLSEQERAYLPRYERVQLARSIYAFQYYKSHDTQRTHPHEWNPNAAETTLVPILENPEQSAALYQEMTQIMERVSPEERYYDVMKRAMRDMTAYQRGEYSLFTPLPEEVLEAERAKRQAEKDAKKAEQQEKRQSRRKAKEAVPPEPEADPELNTPEAREAGEIDLMAAARRLSRKKGTPVTERANGQFSLFGASDEPEEEPSPEMEPAATLSGQEPESASEESAQEESEPEESQTWEESPEVEAETAAEPVSTVERDDYMLIRKGDVYPLYEEKARRAAELLHLPLTEAELSADGSVDACEIPAARLEEAIDKLRIGFNVSLMDVDGSGELKLVRRYPATGEVPERSAEPEKAVEAKPAKQYDLGYGYLGNGLTVWNRAEEVNGDYRTAAHIGEDRSVTIYDEEMPEAIRDKIRQIAATSNETISASQDAPVFRTPPQTADKEAEISAPDEKNAEDEQTEAPHSTGEKNPYISGGFEPGFDENGRERTVFTQADADRQLLLWNGNLCSKITAGRFLLMHGHEPSAAIWLAHEFGDSDLNPRVFQAANSQNSITMTWEEIKERLDVLRDNLQFFTEDERDILNPDRLEATENTRLVQAAKEDDYQLAAATTRGGHFYSVGGRVGTELDVYGGKMNVSLTIQNITSDSVVYTLSDAVDLPPIRMSLERFEAMLDGERLFVIDNPQREEREQPEIYKEKLSAPASSVFEYQGYHFEPAGAFLPGDDFNSISRKIRSDRDMAVSTYDWAKRPWSHEAFFEASGGSSADIFRCLENENVYMPGENELFEFHGEYRPYSRQEQTITAENAAGENVTERESEKESQPPAAASAPAAKTPEKPKKRQSQGRAAKNYRAFAEMFPDFLNQEYRYLRLEVPGKTGYEPLNLEWISGNVIAVSHSYIQNGDVMHDPEMTFRVDRDEGTLEPLTFQQDNLGIYQEVYPAPGRWIPVLRRDLNAFTETWFSNISNTPFVRKRAVIEHDGEDTDIYFDEQGSRIPDAPEPVMPEAVPPESDAPEEPSLTPNVDEYLKLKAQYPDKLVGVQVGDYMLFYGKDAETAGPALGSDIVTRDIPGLGETSVTGSSLGWQSILRRLLENGQNVVLVEPDTEKGVDAPYTLIKKRDASEFIPIANPNVTQSAEECGFHGCIVSYL